MNRVGPWLAAIILSWGLYRLSEHFWEPAIFAAALSVAFWPCAQWLRPRLGRRLSSLTMAAVLVVGLAAPGCWAWSSAFSELDRLVEKVEAEMSINVGKDWQNKSRQWGISLAIRAKKSQAWSARAEAAGEIPWGEIGLTAIFIYFMFADGARTAAWANERARHHGGEQGEQAWASAGRAFCSTAKGCLWFGLLSFGILWILFYIAGAPSPLAFAVAGACASMLPFVAPIMVASMAAALLAPENIFGPAALLLFGAGGLGLANNVLRPKWVGDASGLPMPAALIGMAGGALAWGPAGLLAGPALLAGSLSLIGRREKVQEKRP